MFSCTWYQARSRSLRKWLRSESGLHLQDGGCNRYPVCPSTNTPLVSIVWDGLLTFTRFRHLNISKQTKIVIISIKFANISIKIAHVSIKIKLGLQFITKVQGTNFRSNYLSHSLLAACPLQSWHAMGFDCNLPRSSPKFHYARVHIYFGTYNRASIAPGDARNWNDTIIRRPEIVRDDFRSDHLDLGLVMLRILSAVNKTDGSNYCF